MNRGCSLAVITCRKGTANLGTIANLIIQWVHSSTVHQLLLLMRFQLPPTFWVHLQLPWLQLFLFQSCRMNLVQRQNRELPKRKTNLMETAWAVQWIWCFRATALFRFRLSSMQVRVPTRALPGIVGKIVKFTILVELHLLTPEMMFSQHHRITYIFLNSKHPGA